VLERLIANGARVVAVTCVTRTLEDVYADAMSEAAADGSRQLGDEGMTTFATHMAE